MHTLNELNSWVCQSNDPNNNQQAALHSQLVTSQLNPNTGGILLSNTVELVTGGDDLVVASSNLLNGQQPQMSIQCTVAGETDLVQNTGGKIFGSNRGISFVKYPSNQQFQANSLSNGHLSGLNAHLSGNLSNNLSSNLSSNSSSNLSANLLNNQNNSTAFNGGAYSLLHQSMNSLTGSVSNTSNNSNSSTLSSSSSNNSLAYTSLNLSHNSSSGGTSPSTTTVGQHQQLAAAGQSTGLAGQYAAANGYANQLNYSSFDQLMATNSIPTPSPEQHWLPNSPQHSPDQHHQTALHPHYHHSQIAQSHQFTTSSQSNSHSPQHHINLPTPPSLANGGHHTQRDQLTANQFQPQQSNRRLDGRHYNGHYNGYNAFNQTQQRQQVSILVFLNSRSILD